MEAQCIYSLGVSGYVTAIFKVENWQKVYKFKVLNQYIIISITTVPILTKKLFEFLIHYRPTFFWLCLFTLTLLLVPIFSIFVDFFIFSLSAFKPQNKANSYLMDCRC